MRYGKYIIGVVATLSVVALWLYGYQDEATDSQGVSLSTADSTVFVNDINTVEEHISGRLEADNGFAWNYGHDLALRNGVLLVKVRINLVPGQGIRRVDLDRVKPTWEKGMEEVWSDRVALVTAEGRPYPVAVDVSFRGPGFHHYVIVRPGAGRTDELNWNLEDNPVLVAHELGHMLGLYDEYEGGALAPRHPIIDPESIMTSNPGEGAQTRPRHYELFRKWFENKTMINNVRISYVN